MRSQRLKLGGSHGISHRLVDGHVDEDEVAVLWLADKFCNGANIVERTLGVDDTHDTVHPSHCSETARMVQTVLRAWDGVHVELNADTILATPFSGSETRRNEPKTVVDSKA